MDLALSGDLLSAGAALAGLILVFLGGVLNSYAEYDTVQQKSVRTKFRRRAWLCFVGFLFSVAGTLFAFLAEVCHSRGWMTASAAALGAGFVVTLIMAFLEVSSI